MNDRIVHRLAGLLLDYPTEELLEGLPLLQAAAQSLPPSARRSLTPMLGRLAAAPLERLQLDYVEVFDMTKKRALYLSYWTDGDTRRRGEVLGRFKARYRASGWLVDTQGELTDYLPMVLEYAAIADPVDGPALLQEYRPSLELLKFALRDIDSPYAGVVEAVCDTLPGASPGDAATVHRMAADGPPREEVGLDAYDPRLLPLSSPGAPR